MVAVVFTMEVEIEKFGRGIRSEGRPNGAVRRPGPGSAFCCFPLVLV